MELQTLAPAEDAATVDIFHDSVWAVANTLGGAKMDSEGCRSLFPVQQVPSLHSFPTKPYTQKHALLSIKVQKNSPS
jgi:hypothetical protein